MGKRSSGFERRDRDFYPTPPAAVVPLLSHLERQTFAEPCCGDGALVRALEAEGLECTWASDLEPRGYGVACDVFDRAPETMPGEMFITNPPWSRDVLHPLIERLSADRPTWLLFDADWSHTRQAVPLLGRCRKIVSVGRVKWIEGSPHTGKDNAAWYLFGPDGLGPVEFFGRIT